MNSLRNATIRLAHSNPELRELILPLVKRAKPLARGTGMESAKSMLRFHRYADNIQVLDLTNAGKRGKTVEGFSVGGVGNEFGQSGPPEITNGVDFFVGRLVGARNFTHARAIAEEWVALGRQHGVVFRINDLHPQKGVRVDPPRSDKAPPKVIDGTHVMVRVDSQREFVVNDKDDKNNEPAIMRPSRSGVTHAKRFYAWISQRENQQFVQRAKFRDVLRALDAAGIEYHYWLRMD